MVDEYLINKIKQLENENLELKKQVEKLKDNTLGWDNLRYLIDDRLNVLDLKKTRPYGNLQFKIISAVSQILRETFNFKYIKDLREEHYDKAKELTEVVLNFVISNFVEDKYFKNIKEFKEE